MARKPGVILHTLFGKNPHQFHFSSIDVVRHVASDSRASVHDYLPQIILSILSDESFKRAEECHSGTSGTVTFQKRLAPLEQLPRWYDLRMVDRLSRRHLAATSKVAGRGTRLKHEKKKKSPRLAKCCLKKKHVVVRV